MKLFEQELSLVNIIETIRNIKNRNIRNRQFCKKKFRLLLLICWYIFYFDRYDHLVVSLIYLHLIVCNLKKNRCTTTWFKLKYVACNNYAASSIHFTVVCLNRFLFRICKKNKDKQTNKKQNNILSFNVKFFCHRQYTWMIKSNLNFLTRILLKWI